RLPRTHRATRRGCHRGSARAEWTPPGLFDQAAEQRLQTGRALDLAPQRLELPLVDDEGAVFHLALHIVGGEADGRLALLLAQLVVQQLERRGVESALDGGFLHDLAAPPGERERARDTVLRHDATSGVDATTRPRAAARPPRRRDPAAGRP